MAATQPPVSVTAAALRQWRQTALIQAPQLEPGEVDWLLAELAQIEPWQLRQAPSDQPFQLPCSLGDLEALWQQRREQRVPLQYLVGHTPWRRFRLRVSPAVLVPRPETELIVEIAQAIAQAQGLTTGHWADLGTGSGAIALGLAQLLPGITVHGVDCSPAALAVAQSNIDRHRSPPSLPLASLEGGDRFVPLSKPTPTPIPTSHPIQLHQGQWFEPLAPWRGQLQAMVSNPPYIPTPLLAELEPEVRLHEPRLALDGGPGGLDCLSHLVRTAPDYLCAGGLWLVELMAGQAAAVVALLEAEGHYTGIQTHRDLSGIERFVSALVSAPISAPVSPLGR